MAANSGLRTRPSSPRRVWRMSAEGGDDVQRIAGRFSCRRARAHHVRAVAAGTGAGRARILLSASESSSSGACGSRWPPGSNGTETYAKRGHRVRVAAGVVRPQTRGQREGKLPSAVPLATAWLPPRRQPSFWRPRSTSLRSSARGTCFTVIDVLRSEEVALSRSFSSKGPGAPPTQSARHEIGSTQRASLSHSLKSFSALLEAIFCRSESWGSVAKNPRWSSMQTLWNG